MVQSVESHLQGIVSISDQILDLLASHVPRITIKTQGRLPTPPLRLPDVDSQSLHQALSRRNLSASLIRSVDSLYIKRDNDIQHYHQKHWQQLLQSCPGITERHIILLNDKFQTSYIDACQQVQSKLLNVLDAYSKRFSCDAEAATKSDYESSSEDGLPNNRGHSRLAVAILEKAYSHTTNITRAEKVRLAAATKLESRQVTIWVSATAIYDSCFLDREEQGGYRPPMRVDELVGLGAFKREQREKSRYYWSKFDLRRKLMRFDLPCAVSEQTQPESGRSNDKADPRNTECEST